MLEEILRVTPPVADVTLLADLADLAYDARPRPGRPRGASYRHRPRIAAIRYSSQAEGAAGHRSLTG